MQKKKGLGRGIAALIPEKIAAEKERYRLLNVGDVAANPLQPRQVFSASEIDDLKASIAQDGLLQPIVVAAEGEKFKLIAGERRLRAVKSLGWEKIPAIVLEEIKEVELLRKSLVENIQRANLNAIEEAHAYKKLLDDYGYSLERLSQELGKDVSTISNFVRLLNLPLEIQEELKKGFISPGHGRALLALRDVTQMRRLLEEIKQGKISVRETEKRVKKKKAKVNIDPNLQDMIERLQRKLGTKVLLTPKKGGGKLEIVYFNQDDLQRIIRVLLPGEQR